MTSFMTFFSKFSKNLNIKIDKVEILISMVRVSMRVLQALQVVPPNMNAQVLLVSEITRFWVFFFQKKIQKNSFEI